MRLVKALFPTFIRTYLLDEDDHFRDTADQHGSAGSAAR